MKKTTFISRLVVWQLILLVAFTGCGGGRKHIELSKAPKPVFVPGVTPPLPEYTIGIGDILEVKFFYDPELNETLLVRSDGRITLPRLGDFAVVGLTPTQLDDIVTTKYSEILRNPDITVLIRESAEEVVYVLGEVGSPGAVPIRGRMSLLQAIAASGGLTYIAKSSSVIVFHSDGLHRPTARRINLSKALNRKDINENIYLTGYDIIYVPKTFIGKLDIFVDQFFKNVFPPLLDTYIKGYDAYRMKDRYDYYRRLGQ